MTFVTPLPENHFKHGFLTLTLLVKHILSILMNYKLFDDPSFLVTGTDP